MSFLKLKPTIRDKRETTEHNNGSKWLIDSEYFNINQIKIVLKKGSNELHNEFWNELSIMLSSIE